MNYKCLFSLLMKTIMKTNKNSSMIRRQNNNGKHASCSLKVTTN